MIYIKQIYIDGHKSMEHLKTPEMGRKLFGEDYAKMTHALITKMALQGKTNDEIQKATGEHGKRIELIRKSTEKKKVNDHLYLWKVEQCPALVLFR